MACPIRKLVKERECESSDNSPWASKGHLVSNTDLTKGMVSSSPQIPRKINLSELEGAIQDKVKMITKTSETRTTSFQRSNQRGEQLGASVLVSDGETNVSGTGDMSCCRVLKSDSKVSSVRVYDSPWGNDFKVKIPTNKPVSTHWVGNVPLPSRINGPETEIFEMSDENAKQENTVPNKDYDAPWGNNFKLKIPKRPKNCSPKQHGRYLTDSGTCNGESTQRNCVGALVDQMKATDAADGSEVCAGGYDDPWNEGFKIPKEIYRRNSEDGTKDNVGANQQEDKVLLKREQKTMSKEWPRLDRMKHQIINTSSNVVDELKRMKTRFIRSVSKKNYGKDSKSDQLQFSDEDEDDTTYEDIAS